MTMKESTRKKMVYALLVGAIIFGLIMKPWESSRKRRASQTNDEPPSQTTSVVAASVGSAPPPTDFAMTWSRDPFATPDEERDATVPVIHQTAVVPSGEYVLNGILVVEGEPACVLNGQAFLVGEMIEGWRVEYIGHNEVLLVRASDKKRLVLP